MQFGAILYSESKITQPRNYPFFSHFGGKVFRKKYNENNTESLYFHCNNFNVFRLSHKLKKQKEFNKNSLEINSRFITKIEKIKSVPTKCIVVDSENHLFLCTKNYIPTHNSTVTCAFILWYVLFNESKTVALLANKGDTAREILHKIQLAYQHLPKWLQQGVGEWQKGNFELENNSRVIATATSSDAIRGYSINDLHDLCKERVALDNEESVYLPNPVFTDNPKYCLVAMEPSI